MKNQVQLIAYVDRMSGGGLQALQELLEGPLQGVFGGVHLLPFFFPIDGADAGFDPIDHTQVDPKLGDWSDVRKLGGSVEIMADLIVNHASADSPQFQDYSRNGSKSPYAGMFLTMSSVFANGASEEDLLKIYRPRPGMPFTKVTLANGEQHLLWTTFTSQQVDIDVHNPEGRAYLDAILAEFHKSGIKAIRLDAAGYAIKKQGSSCFMIPETFEFIAELTKQAHALGIEALVEIHSHYQQQIEIAKRVDLVYDFALPPLVLHALYEGDARYLGKWLSISPRNAVTVLDTHDGIGVIDVGADSEGRPGLLPPEAIDRLVETMHAKSNNQSRQATGAAASNLDLYQVNSTFYDALGRNDTEYLIARAVQFFAPGIPQVYYNGLLAEPNDMELLARSRVGRDINRHYFTAEEARTAIETRPVVKRLIELIRFRNSHAAFQQGWVAVSTVNDSALSITWRSGAEWATLEAQFAKPAWATIAYSTPAGSETMEVK